VSSQVVFCSPRMSQMANETVQLSLVIAKTTKSVDDLYFTVNGIASLLNPFAELQT
jgi:hypothetical protein